MPRRYKRKRMHALKKMGHIYRIAPDGEITFVQWAAFRDCSIKDAESELRGLVDSEYATWAQSVGNSRMAIRCTLPVPALRDPNPPPQATPKPDPSLDFTSNPNGLSIAPSAVSGAKPGRHQVADDLTTVAGMLTDIAANLRAV